MIITFVVKKKNYIKCQMESCWCAKNVHEQHEEVELPTFGMGLGFRVHSLTILRI